jgi:hypothetical protein
METTYLFDELQIPAFGEGALFYGKAFLKDNSGETDVFVVDAIELDSGRTLSARSTTTLERELFKAICEVLYDDKSVNGKYAAMEWADFVSGAMPAVPMFKPRAGLLGLIVQGANLARADMGAQS